MFGCVMRPRVMLRCSVLGVAFVGLTGIVFTIGRDFGFLGKLLALGGTVPAC